MPQGQQNNKQYVRYALDPCVHLLAETAMSTDNAHRPDLSASQDRH